MGSRRRRLSAQVSHARVGVRGPNNALSFREARSCLFELPRRLRYLMLNRRGVDPSAACPLIPAPSCTSTVCPSTQLSPLSASSVPRLSGGAAPRDDFPPMGSHHRAPGGLHAPVREVSAPTAALPHVHLSGRPCCPPARALQLADGSPPGSLAGSAAAGTRRLPAHGQPPQRTRRAGRAARGEPPQRARWAHVRWTMGRRHRREPAPRHGGAGGCG